MFEINDKVVVKKTHPCGNNIFTIIRQGADYKIKCDKCGRVILMTYDELKKCVKKHIKEEKNNE